MLIAVKRSGRSPNGVKASRKEYLHQAARAAYANYIRTGRTKAAWKRLVSTHAKRGLGGQLSVETANHIYD